MKLRVSFLAASIILAMSTAGCGAPQPAASSPAATPQMRPPLRIACLIDKTASATWTRVPAVTADDFLPLIALLAERGGEMRVGLIRDRSNYGLLALPLCPAPAAPAPPDPNQNPFLLAEARVAHAGRLRAHENRTRVWKQELEQRVAGFREQLGRLLAEPADAGRTDLWDAIRRAELFLNEPEAGGAPAASKWLLVLSDGEDNVRRPPVSLRSGARLLLVNSSGSLGDLADLQPLAFESFQAATAYLTAKEK